MTLSQAQFQKATAALQQKQDLLQQQKLDLQEEEAMMSDPNIKVDYETGNIIVEDKDDLEEQMASSDPFDLEEEEQKQMEDLLKAANLTVPHAANNDVPFDITPLQSFAVLESVDINEKRNIKVLDTHTSEIVSMPVVDVDHFQPKDTEPILREEEIKNTPPLASAEKRKNEVHPPTDHKIPHSSATTKTSLSKFFSKYFSTKTTASPAPPPNVSLDPAVLQIDLQLLLDIVTLAITAALFGLLAVFLHLPPTAGMLLGGMLIGPSCWDLMEYKVQVRTLSMFGSIFLLFQQGLAYSQTWKSGDKMQDASTAATNVGRGYEVRHIVRRIEENDSSSPTMRRKRSIGNSSTLTSSSSPSGSGLQYPPPSPQNEHNPTIVGAIVLVLLVFVSFAIFLFYASEKSSSPSVMEAMIVASSIALCSTTVVSENLHAAGLGGTTWGNGVLKMIAMQDLFMVPILALPEMIGYFNEIVNENSSHHAYGKEEEYGSVKEADDDDDIASHEEKILRKFSSGILFHLVIVAMFAKGSIFLAKHVVHAAAMADAKMKSVKSCELFTLSVVAYALLMATICEELQLSIEAGALFAGIVLIKSPHVPKVLDSIESITSVFGGMFLTSMGTIISPAFVMSHIGTIMLLVICIGLFKMVLVSIVLNRCFDYGITPSLAVGSAMAQISEISLVVLAKSQRLGLVSRKVYLMLIPTTCILLSLAPFSASHL